MASTNRLISYAQGLASFSNRVEILCLKPGENPSKIVNKEVQGKFGDLNFRYVTGSTIRPKSLIKRISIRLLSFIGTIFYIISLNRKNRINTIITFPSSFLFIFIIFLISRILKIKLVHERSEYPFITQKNTFLFRLNLFIYLHFSCKLYDAFVVITKALETYFYHYKSSKAKTFILPILVEPERFSDCNTPSPIQGEYIGYCGSMEGNKDGISDLIEAFHLIASGYPDLKLVLIGDKSFKDFANLENDIRAKNLSERIIFTGQIERDDLPAFLYNAKLLVLARPDNKQSEGGFPTKLGEYLATGKPVVITRVGEIPLYLKDGVNGFIAEPGNSEDFARKMNEVLQDYANSIKIGKCGQKLTFSSFNYLEQSKKLMQFLKELAR